MNIWLAILTGISLYNIYMLIKIEYQIKRIQWNKDVIEHLVKESEHKK